MQHGDPGIEGPGIVSEGGSIEIKVTNGATEVAVYVGEDPTPAKIRVVGGKASIPVPPRATGGMFITIITTGTNPPASLLVEVIGSTGR